MSAYIGCHSLRWLTISETRSYYQCGLMTLLATLAFASNIDRPLLRGRPNLDGGKSARPLRNECVSIVAFTNGKHTPGSPMKIGAELQVYYFACTTLKRRFCIHCHWCDSCISKGTARGLRKGVHAGPNGEASVVEFQNICKRHDWQGGMPADSRSNLLTT